MNELTFDDTIDNVFDASQIASTEYENITDMIDEFQNIDDSEYVNPAEDIGTAFAPEELHSENFDEVLQLSEYTNQSGAIDKFVVAEYTDINVFETDKKHQISAKSFVNKITKFILEFNDVTLNEEHKKYLKQVANLQLQHLTDLLFMVDVNKQMLNNIIARVNATQAEDYAIIATYTSLANHHLKLIKELQNTYKAIPSVLKKMKTEVLCNQELLGEGEAGDEVFSAEFGQTQFNSGKQMLRTILENRERESNEDKTKKHVK
jgi:hypothetical protein